MEPSTSTSTKKFLEVSSIISFFFIIGEVKFTHQRKDNGHQYISCLTKPGMKIRPLFIAKDHFLQIYDILYVWTADFDSQVYGYKIPDYKISTDISLENNKKLLISYNGTPANEKSSVEMNYYDCEYDILRSSGSKFILFGAKQIRAFKELRSEFRMKIEKAFAFGNYLEYVFDVIYQLYSENKKKNLGALLENAITSTDQKEFVNRWRVKNEEVLAKERIKMEIFGFSLLKNIKRRYQTQFLDYTAVNETVLQELNSL
ncbi:UNVERIFIED_CONTAM: hypothetical protein RMT77_012289 [Armadillidium vulgare]